MRKAIIGAVAAVAAMTLAASWEVAHAAPCEDCSGLSGLAAGSCTADQAMNPACAGAPAAVNPPTTQAPITAPVQAPQVNPPTTVRPVTVPTPSVPSATVKPVALPTPKDVSAPDAAVAAAKSAPAVIIDPRNPPPPPVGIQPVDVAAAVQQNSQQAQAPQHWGFVDYDTNRDPVLYNPVGVDMTFRYFYDGDYRDVYVAAGGRVALNTTISGVFPFTAVGMGYVSAGCFDGGGYNPVVWNNVNAYVPAVNTTLAVNRVAVVGHDDNAPSGQQDTMMLNDTTLARGQVQQGADNGTVDIAATQSTPGVGPWDNGGAIVNTALQAAPAKHNWVLYALLVLAGVVLAGVATWVIIKRRTGATAAR